MAIIGLGVDLVEIIRIEKIFNHFKERLAKRILSIQEWQQYQKQSRPIHFLAKRYAIKEAAAKALGIGLQNGIYFKQFKIFNDKLGKPKLNLLGQAKIIADLLNIKYIHVSLSDERKYIYAIVIMET